MSDVDPTTGRRTATDRRQHFRMATGSFTRPGKFAEITDPIERSVTRDLYAAAIDWSKEHGTDGHLVLEDLCGLLGLPLEYGKNLIALDLCHQADHGCRRCTQPRMDRVVIHDYLEHNRSAAQDERTRRARQAGGNTASALRWEGHVVPVREKRPPGRPRKNPAPAAGLLQELETGQLELGLEMHPAEARARAEAAGIRRPGRPRKTEPRTFEPEVYQLCELLASRVRENGYTVAKTFSVNTWLLPCQQLLTRGVPHSDPPAPISPENISKAILWATDDALWSKNIRSMDKLRKHYERLRDDAMDTQRPKRGQRGRVRRVGSGGPPAAVTVPSMASRLAAQMGAPKGMIKGG